MIGRGIYKSMGTTKRAKTSTHNGLSGSPDLKSSPKSALKALALIDESVLAIETAINIGDDYFEHKTALLSAVEEARDAGCSEEEIKIARRGF